MGSATLFEQVRQKITTLRDYEVILDADVAVLYGVETKRINEAVRNNPDKFPENYMFTLTHEEVASLRSKISTTSIFPKSRVLPKAFTEKGLYVLATILKSKQAINATVEDDIPKYAEMTVAAAVKLKKLMYMLAQSVPYKPNHTMLARDLDISRNILPDYIEYLEKSGLFNALREKSTGDGILQKVEKLYLGNSNIIYALGLDKADEGTIRETMFLTWMKEKHSVSSSRISDFEIEGITFEVGGKNKKGKQLKEAATGYIVKDNIEYATGKNIPIWMFGFIY